MFNYDSVAAFLDKTDGKLLTQTRTGIACLWAHLNHTPFYLCFSTWPDLRLEY
jgi:hypothetical protein